MPCFSTVAEACPGPSLALLTAWAPLRGEAVRVAAPRSVTLAAALPRCRGSSPPPRGHELLLDLSPGRPGWAAT